MHLLAASVPVPYPSWLNTGDNTWQLVAATLVGLMSIPGLAVLYASIVQKKWAVNVLAMTFAGFSLVLIVWVLWAYKMGFGSTSIGGGVHNGVWTQQPLSGINPIGTLKHFFDNMVGKPGQIMNGPAEQSQAVSAANTAIPFHFPTMTLAYFQFVFAAITPLLFLGSVMGRIKFSAWVLLVPMWTTFVYAIDAFLLWGGGYFAQEGALDFSGGFVIHMSAGVSGFVAAWVLGPRLARDRRHALPNNLVVAAIGAGILWLGWNGFNGGDPYYAGVDAAAAVVNTNLATASGVLMWMALDGVFTRSKKPTFLGGVNGMICGLVAITPSAGWVNGWGAIAVGVAIGVPAARMVKMTAIPQMVAIFNGVGGAAAALVSISEFSREAGTHPATYQVVEVLAGVLIGSVSFSGSVVAFAKLQEIMTGRPLTYPGQQAVNAALGVVILALVGAGLGTDSTIAVIALLALSLVLGVAFVLPIGGADVPVLISLLNSFTGIAVAATGFVLRSTVLIVAGTLVGASGTLLTRMMSKAMGRSITNILFGAFGSVITASGSMEGATGGSVKAGTVEDIGVLLAYSRKVAIVPGYGLAVAQAQHVARELADELAKHGVEVFYAIHPVAGRMPGHMNVLLAEANVPYEQLKEMDQANPELPTADVALVVGANDVVNPAARNSPGSPIYGMPILNVDEASNVVFLKRSMRPGFAGIDNELLYDPKTTMLFGDAKDSLTKLVAAVAAT